MNPWPFVIAAYAIALVATIVLVVTSFRAMRKAEARLEELGRGGPEPALEREQN